MISELVHITKIVLLVEENYLEGNLYFIPITFVFNHLKIKVIKVRFFKNDFTNVGLFSFPTFSDSFITVSKALMVQQIY